MIPVDSTRPVDAHADAGPDVRPCCRFEMLEDMWSYMSSITLREPQRQQGRLRHFVLASAASAYNLGGDLDLFGRLIREGNRERLLAYYAAQVGGRAGAESTRLFPYGAVQRLTQALGAGVRSTLSMVPASTSASMTFWVGAS